jgi:hypothetical protein|tara:strand:+ start:47 stop:439 length:393 start_codon:yes stop_codon:yes gene_type:complete
MPVFAPVLVAAGGTALKYAVGTTVVYFVGKELVATVNEDAGERIEDIETILVENGLNILEGTAEQLGSLSLTFVEGFGSALITGFERAYDTVRDKLRGREDNVIAGFTVGFIALLTITYLYQSVKRGGDL